MVEHPAEGIAHIFCPDFCQFCSMLFKQNCLGRSPIFGFILLLHFYWKFGRGRGDIHMLWFLCACTYTTVCSKVGVTNLGDSFLYLGQRQFFLVKYSGWKTVCVLIVGGTQHLYFKRWGDKEEKRLGTPSSKELIMKIQQSTEKTWQVNGDCLLTFSPKLTF